MLFHVVVLLTIASTLGHALLGCCGHHVHAQDGAGHEVRGTSHHHTGTGDVAHEHDHCAESVASEGALPLDLHSHGSGSPLDDGSHDHNDGTCSEPPCAYVMTDASRIVDAGDLPATLLPPGLTLSASPDVLLLARRSTLEISAADPDKDAARGRSRLGVWLL